MSRRLALVPPAPAGRAPLPQAAEPSVTAAPGTPGAAGDGSARRRSPSRGNASPTGAVQHHMAWLAMAWIMPRR